ncbi:MAG: NfeD family protein [Limisphaerales bacterium]
MKWWVNTFLMLTLALSLPAADPAAEKQDEKPSAKDESKDEKEKDVGKDEKEDKDDDEPKIESPPETFVRNEVELPEDISNVFVIPLRDAIFEHITYTLRRGVKQAIAAEADLIILDMHTPGGSVAVTMDIFEILEKFDGPVITFINRDAGSAGVFISAATQRIYMHPMGTIGAAAPVFSTGGDIPETLAEKFKSFMGAKLRGICEKNGHNWAVIEAMIRMERELVIDGKVLSKEGELLSLTAAEAEKEYGDPPQYLLSAGTVDDIDALLVKIGAEGVEPTQVVSTGAESLAGWLNKIAPILMMIGLAGLYIEYKTPGFGVFGVIGILAFLLYFFGSYVAGMSGVEWIAVFFFGVALIAVELFVLPGTVFIGLSGIGLVILSIIMSGVDLYPNMPVVGNFDSISQSLNQSMQNFALGIIGGFLACWGLSRILPHTPYYGAVVSQGVSGVESVAAIAAEKKSRVGEVGDAISQLRPGGKAQFGDEILDVISAGDIIESGERIKIVSHSGADPVVEKAD